MWLLVTQKKTIGKLTHAIKKTLDSKSLSVDYVWLQGTDHEFACTTLRDPHNPLFDVIIILNPDDTKFGTQISS